MVVVAVVAASGVALNARKGGGTRQPAARRQRRRREGGRDDGWQHLQLLLNASCNCEEGRKEGRAARLLRIIYEKRGGGKEGSE